MKKNIFIWFGIFCMLFITSCNEETKSWSIDEVNNLQISLIDDSIIESYHFLEDGYVIATIGIVNDSVCGPVFEWKIDPDGNLCIYGPDTEITLKKLNKSDRVIEVLENGLKKQYNILKD